MRKYKKLELIDDKIGNLFFKSIWQQPVKDEYQEFVSNLDGIICETQDERMIECLIGINKTIEGLWKKEIPLEMIVNMLARQSIEIIIQNPWINDDPSDFLRKMFEFQLKEVKENYKD